MKKLALALCALLVASSALAAPRQYGLLARWQQTGFPGSMKPKNQRVAVIYDREFRDSNLDAANICDRDLFAGAGKIVEVLRNQGADVNVFDQYMFADSNAMIPANVALGQTVTGTGIPGGTVVSYISPQREFMEISNNATANNQAATLTIGGVTGGAQWKIVSGTAQVRLMLGSNPAFRTLGDTYGLVVMFGFRALFRTNDTHELKFFNPESTNCQMVHVGGIPSYASFDDGTTKFGVGDSTRSMFHSEGVTNGRGAVPYNGSGGLMADTLWGERINYACPPMVYFAAPPTGFRMFVRLFHPVLVTGNGAASDSALYWGSAMDSTDSAKQLVPGQYNGATTFYRYRAGWWNTHADSVVRQPYEPMPIAWRTYWTDTNADGKDHVDFVKVSSGLNTRFVNGDVALALCARYVNLKPVLMAMEWDDMGNMNPTEGHSGPIGIDALPTTFVPAGSRPQNATLDSLVSEMKNVWGVKLTTNIEPDTAVAYIRGTPANQWANNPAGAVSPYTYLVTRALPWVHHSHDSTAFIGANLIGKFGGYYPHNGQTVNSGGYTVQAFTHRVASIGDPFNLLNVRDPYKYGIRERLNYSDSLRRVVCPQCPLPPYLSFPNNDMLPLDWTVRNSPFPTQTGNGGLPLANYFMAIAEGLGVQRNLSTIYLRGYYYILNTGTALVPNPAPHVYKGVRYPQFSPVNRWIGYDRDSLATASLWMEPGGEYRVLATPTTPGANLRVRNVGTVPIGNASATMLQQFAQSQRVRNMLLGTFSPIVRQSVWANDFGETYTSDANGMLSGNTNIIRNGPGRVRVVYCHPLGGTYLPDGVTEVAQMRTVVLRPLDALAQIAGHRIHQWVYPWETLEP